MQVVFHFSCRNRTEGRLNHNLSRVL